MKLYEGTKGTKNQFLAEVSGLDTAVGNLRAELRKLGIADETIFWFASHNGGITPQSLDPSGKGKGNIGVRTVSCIEWPGRFKTPIHPLDDISLIPVLEGKVKERTKSMGFLTNAKGGALATSDFVKDTQGVWIDWPYKLIVTPEGVQAKKGPAAPIVLYHLIDDPVEKTNLADRQPEQVVKMRRALEAWQRSVRDSFDGKDYKK